MERKTLDDKNVHPTDAIISELIGTVFPLWQSLFDFIHEHHPDIHQEWRYYRDGHRWLLKVTRKAKTVAWISAFEGAFTVTFYFAVSAASVVKGSKIPEDLKDQFNRGKNYNTIRGISVDVKRAKDIAAIKAMIELKLQVMAK